MAILINAASAGKNLVGYKNNFQDARECLMEKVVRCF
jgi:hypothetical protein